MALQYSTPGVYIEELDAFPHSIVEVPTAIPAFIGYTQSAADDNKKSLIGVPYPIESQSDYETYFGTGFTAQFALTPAGDLDATKLAATPRYYLYDSIRLFYANGGGQCYIISMGIYSDPKNAPVTDFVKPLTPADSSTKDASIGTLYKVSDVTMIVIPDAAAMTPADQATVYQRVLMHCSDTQSRMGIFDTNLPADAKFNTINTLVNGDGTPANPGFRASMGTNFLNYGAAYFPWLECNIVPSSEVDFTNLAIDPGSLAQTFKDANVTAIYAIYSKAINDATAPVTAAQAVATPLQNAVNNAIAGLAAAKAAKPPVLATIAAAQATLDQANTALAPAQAILDKATSNLNTTTASAKRTFQLALVASSASYKLLMTKITTAVNELPPSGAMAGVYTSVDNNRGVWKAPANVSLNSVNAPSVDLDKNLTDNLNVDALTGKSINAIRSFPGFGTLVFGGRTLDGNSQDWRYINVRRTLIMMEQSIKLAMRAYVFEPNDDTTWITVISMISNFLTNLWKQGALAGLKPEDAFQVMCGLGVTMTAQDILDGYLRVTVKVAVVHPAEFIVLTFQQELQTS